MFPRYVQMLREDANPERRPSFMHLGHWDEPDARPLAYGVYRAQRVLADLIIDMAAVEDGNTVLDVGCGFGGLSQVLNERFSKVHAIGVDLDRTQLHVCSSLASRLDNHLSWLYADAIALPLRRNSLDAVISIESAMHFQSRESFFREATRVLRSRGRVVMVDLLLDLDEAQSRGYELSHIQRVLDQDFEPLPQLSCELDDLLDAARDSGLRCINITNASANTLPTYSPYAYVDEAPPGMMVLGSQESIGLFVEMHEIGVLNVYYLVFESN